MLFIRVATNGCFSFTKGSPLLRFADISDLQVFNAQHSKPVWFISAKKLATILLGHLSQLTYFRLVYNERVYLLIYNLWWVLQRCGKFPLSPFAVGDFLSSHCLFSEPFSKPVLLEKKEEKFACPPLLKRICSCVLKIYFQRYLCWKLV